MFIEDIMTKNENTILQYYDLFNLTKGIRIRIQVKKFQIRILHIHADPIENISASSAEVLFEEFGLFTCFATES